MIYKFDNVDTSIPIPRGKATTFQLPSCFIPLKGCFNLYNYVNKAPLIEKRKWIERKKKVLN